MRATAARSLKERTPGGFDVRHPNDRCAQRSPQGDLGLLEIEQALQALASRRYPALADRPRADLAHVQPLGRVDLDQIELKEWV
jgi:hypothetical protein